jgi:hypothetical protein
MRKRREWSHMELTQGGGAMSHDAPPRTTPGFVTTGLTVFVYLVSLSGVTVGMPYLFDLVTDQPNV